MSQILETDYFTIFEIHNSVKPFSVENAITQSGSTAIFVCIQLFIRLHLQIIFPTQTRKGRFIVEK